MLGKLRHYFIGVVSSLITVTHFWDKLFENPMRKGVNAPLGKVNVVIHKDMH